jgi:H+/gluconate symporter-like permease
MKIEQLAYWAAFAIPFILIIVQASAEKLVEKAPWHWKHFYCGLDLILAVLAAALVNILDLAKGKNEDTHQALIMTALFISGSIVILFGLSGVHQDWESEEKYGFGQVVWLGIASNAVGITLAYAFVRMKEKGLL